MRGRVVLLTTSLNADWNSWPASPIFPPFIDRLMLFRRRRPAARAGRRGRRADRAVPRHRRRRRGRRSHARRPGGIGPRPRPGRRRRSALDRRRRERRLPLSPSARRDADVSSSPSTRRPSTRPNRPALATWRGPGPKTSKRPIPTGISRSLPIRTRSFTPPAPAAVVEYEPFGGRSRTCCYW